MLDALGQDIRHGLRLVRRYKAFSATVVVILGLGLGANTAIFSVVNAAMLAALPFEGADRLVVVNGTLDRPDGPQVRRMSYPDFRDWRESSRSFEGLAAMSGISVNLVGEGDSERVAAEVVTREYFDVLAVEPALGRVFVPEEDARLDEHPVAVLGHGLWIRRFGGSAAALGADVELGGRRFTVIGVMPEGFAGIGLGAELWVPMAMVSLVRSTGVLESRSDRWLVAVGRLADGMEAERAQEDLDAISAGLAAAYPDTNGDRRALLQPLREAYLGNLQLSLLVLLASVGAVLLIACANVTNLLLARSTVRSGEVAVRLALGARRGRLFRQLLTESVVLAAAGGAAGVLVALWCLEGLRLLIPPGVLPAYVEIALDARVFVFTTLVTLGAGLLSGLAPAARGSRAAPDTGVRGARAGTAGLGHRLELQGLVVSGQVAVTAALLVCAGAMAQSLWRQLRVDPGFEPRGLTAFRVALPLEAYGHDDRLRFIEQVARGLRAGLPRARMSAGTDLPFRGGLSSAGFLWRADAPPRAETGTRYYRHSVDASYFEALGIEMVAGRAFTAGDTAESPPVAVLGAAAARRLWPDRATAVGEAIRLDPEGPEVMVVGVVGDVKFRALTDDLTSTANDPDVYFPLAQASRPELELVVASERPGEGLAGGIRAAVRAVDPGVPVDRLGTMEQALAAQTAMSRLQSMLLVAFGAVALVLGAAGIYGLLAYAVARRRREIGVRLALGATPPHIVKMFVRRGMALALPGLLLGALLGVQGAAAMRGLLYGVAAADPLTLASVTAVVLAAALCASWIPARRAARIDPMATLRTE